MVCCSIEESSSSEEVFFVVSFRTTVHNSSIEIPANEKLAEGTEVYVQVTPLEHSIGLSECDWDDSPEGIADWLNWLDSIEPLNFTEQEIADIEANRHSQKLWEYQMFSAHADKLAQEWK